VAKSLFSHMAKSKQTKSSLPGQGKSKTAVRRRKLKEAERRWFLGVEDLNLGPVSLGKLGVGSGDKRGARNLPMAVEGDMSNTTPPRQRGMMGLAYGTRDIQVVAPAWSTRLRAGRPVSVLSGTEFVTSVSTPDHGDTDAGDLLFSTPINPSVFVKTRIAQFAPLYQRYRFTRLRFLYEPIANATQSGQVIGFCDYDVDNPITTNDPDNINQAAAHVGQARTQIFDFGSFPFGVLDEYTNLYTSLTSGENRLIYQGVFYLIAASLIAAGLPLGNIYIEFECEFTINQLAIGSLPLVLDSLAIVSNKTPTSTDLFNGLTWTATDGPGYPPNTLPFGSSSDAVLVSLPAGVYYLWLTGLNLSLAVPQTTGSTAVTSALAATTTGAGDVTMVPLSDSTPIIQAGLTASAGSCVVTPSLFSQLIVDTDPSVDTIPVAITGVLGGLSTFWQISGSSPLLLFMTSGQLSPPGVGRPKSLRAPKIKPSPGNRALSEARHLQSMIRGYHKAEYTSAPRIKSEIKEPEKVKEANAKHSCKSDLYHEIEQLRLLVDEMTCKAASLAVGLLEPTEMPRTSGSPG